jgi:hypothetical protein
VTRAKRLRQRRAAEVPAQLDLRLHADAPTAMKQAARDDRRSHDAALWRRMQWEGRRARAAAKTTGA